MFLRCSYDLSLALQHSCQLTSMICLLNLQADFMQMPVPDDTYDAVYTIEASCHAPDPVRVKLEFFLAVCDLLGI